MREWHGGTRLPYVAQAVGAAASFALGLALFVTLVAALASGNSNQAATWLWASDLAFKLWMAGFGLTGAAWLLGRGRRERFHGE